MSSKWNNIRMQITRSNKPRSRKSKSNNNNSSIPSLKEFMHRQQVISQYRGFFKAIRTIDDKHSRIAMENEVRSSYKSLLNEQDKLTVTMAVKEV